jgi:hypothetical protein
MRKTKDVKTKESENKKFSKQKDVKTKGSAKQRCENKRKCKPQCKTKDVKKQENHTM